MDEVDRTFIGLFSIELLKAEEFKPMIETMKEYVKNWDTEEHKFAQVMGDGRLIPTNNKDNDGVFLTKQEFETFMTMIEQRKETNSASACT